MIKDWKLFNENIISDEDADIDAGFSAYQKIDDWIPNIDEYESTKSNDIGKIVKIRYDSQFYNQAYEDGGDGIGVIIDYDICDDYKDGLPYIIKWNNGHENSYNKRDFDFIEEIEEMIPDNIKWYNKGKLEEKIEGDPYGEEVWDDLEYMIIGPINTNDYYTISEYLENRGFKWGEDLPTKLITKYRFDKEYPDLCLILHEYGNLGVGSMNWLKNYSRYKSYKILSSDEFIEEFISRNSKSDNIEWYNKGVLEAKDIFGMPVIKPKKYMGEKAIGKKIKISNMSRLYARSQRKDNYIGTIISYNKKAFKKYKVRMENGEEWSMNYGEFVLVDPNYKEPKETIKWYSHGKFIDECEDNETR